MTRPLRVLIIEDREDDAELVFAELRRGGYAPTTRRVETLEELTIALDQGRWDVVLSDYTLPSFSGAAALDALKQRHLDVPFIIVSGTVTEDLAVQALKAGAHDYVLKDRLGRLNSIIERELREATIRAEQRRMEEKLLRADRMASIGALVAGVAHEINNPLAIVLANLDLLAHLAAPPSGPAPRLDADEIQETLRDAREAADRVRVIVAGLKTLSRSDELERGPVDLHRMLDFSIKMAWNEIRHRARLIKAYGQVPAVLGNEARLGQVFLNLLINAAQAIPEGRAGENEIRIATWRCADEGVTVEIRDSGLGMSPEVIARIFDPFFTSKPVGAGTGLGLAICDTIVRAHGGEIIVSSVVGEGSTFVVKLPASEGVPSSLRRATTVIAPARRGRVLVIDDEPAIGIALLRTLQDDHDVEAVTSARAALDLLEAGRRFDLILCDMMMPERTGESLHDELAAKLPDQAGRIVFLTGGAFTPRARAFLARVNNLCLEKPFDGDAVRALCARMIRG